MSNPRSHACLLAVGPEVERRLREPEAVGAESAGGHRFAYADQTFSHQRVGGELGCGRRRESVGGLDAECYERAGRLAGNEAGVKAITRHDVAVSAVVGHSNREQIGRRINAILHPDRGQAVGVLDPRHDADGQIGGRQDGPVSHLVNGRARVGEGLAVAGAGGAEIGGHGQLANCFEVAALEADQDLRPPAQPADPGANRSYLARGKGSRERSANAVGDVVAAVAGAQMQRMGAAITAVGFPGSQAVRALEKPAVGAGLKVGVGQAIRRADEKHLHIVHQRFAWALEKKLELIGIGNGGMAQVEHACVLDRGPTGLGCLIAVRPVRSQAMIAARVNQFEAAAAAVGHWPQRPPVP